MKKQILIWAGVILFGFVAAMIINNNSDSGELDDFAQYLTDKGAVMYGTSWCSYCQKQKDLFGKSFEKINFVDCDKDKAICLSEGIRGYPTWKINGQSYSGLQSLEKLAALTGYELGEK